MATKKRSAKQTPSKPKPAEVEEAPQEDQEAAAPAEPEEPQEPEEPRAVAQEPARYVETFSAGGRPAAYRWRYTTTDGRVLHEDDTDFASAAEARFAGERQRTS